jgi:DNA-directed RNA polymerase subunit M/transcription elongation factor TFIIS
MGKSKKPDIVFECKKCGHLLYVSKDELKEKIQYLIEKDCPNCGEQPPIFIVSHEGDYNEDYGI